MKRPGVAIVGVLLVLVGVVWTLQGTGRLGGSMMSGVTVWAVVGPVVALAGIALVYLGWTRGKNAPGDQAQPPR